MLNDQELHKMMTSKRTVSQAVAGDEALGELASLPGAWSNRPRLEGRGWNMIALPFKGNAPFHYRLLLNQYNEELIFSTVDKNVPNRGITNGGGNTSEGDQFLAALQYIQHITQMATEDFPVSGLVAEVPSAIHHEPGLWLNLANKFDGNDLVRMATIPHGDSVLALGKAKPWVNGAPVIPVISGLPIGESPVPDINQPYFAPYKHFTNPLFKNLFNPVTPNALLSAANQGVNIVRSREIHVDTRTLTGGIVNIPFITRQANATEMQFTMWLQELAEKDGAGKPKLRLQYSQIVFLEFFPRRDGQPGLIRWPHVSINTLEKTV